MWGCFSNTLLLCFASNALLRHDALSWWCETMWSHKNSSKYWVNAMTLVVMLFVKRCRWLCWLWWWCTNVVGLALGHCGLKGEERRRKIDKKLSKFCMLSLGFGRCGWTTSRSQRPCIPHQEEAAVHQNWLTLFKELLNVFHLFFGLVHACGDPPGCSSPQNTQLGRIEEMGQEPTWNIGYK